MSLLVSYGIRCARSYLKKKFNKEHLVLGFVASIDSQILFCIVQALNGSEEKCFFCIINVNKKFRKKNSNHNLN